MKIDKSKLTIADKGDQIVSILLKDEYYSDSFNQTITYMIVKIEYEPKPEEIIVGEEKLPASNSTDKANNLTNSTDLNTTVEDKTDEGSSTIDKKANETIIDFEKVSKDVENESEKQK